MSLIKAIFESARNSLIICVSLVCILAIVLAISFGVLYLALVAIFFLFNLGTVTLGLTAIVWAVLAILGFIFGD